MQLFAGFSQQVESARAGAMDQVSEVDLSDATICAPRSPACRDNVFSGRSSHQSSDNAGHQSAEPSDSPVLVHFGDDDFGAKYQSLIENIGQWRAKAGRVESVDLRFKGSGGESGHAGDTRRRSAPWRRQGADAKAASVVIRKPVEAGTHGAEAVRRRIA